MLSNANAHAYALTHADALPRAQTNAQFGCMLSHAHALVHGCPRTHAHNDANAHNDVSRKHKFFTKEKKGPKEGHSGQWPPSLSSLIYINEFRFSFFPPVFFAFFALPMENTWNIVMEYYRCLCTRSTRCTFDQYSLRSRSRYRTRGI